VFVFTLIGVGLSSRKVRGGTGLHLALGFLIALMYVFAQIGVSVPHSSYSQFGMGTPISINALEPGDLVFFAGASHVGIYIGGGQFIHAPHTGDVVKISSLSGYYSSNFAGASPHLASRATRRSDSRQHSGHCSGSTHRPDRRGRKQGRDSARRRRRRQHASRRRPRSPTRTSQTVSCEREPGGAGS
jgi:hypothetical protein